MFWPLLSPILPVLGSTSISSSTQAFLYLPCNLTSAPASAWESSPHLSECRLRLVTCNGKESQCPVCLSAKYNFVCLPRLRICSHGGFPWRKLGVWPAGCCSFISWKVLIASTYQSQCVQTVLSVVLKLLSESFRYKMIHVSHATRLKNDRKR